MIQAHWQHRLEPSRTVWLAQQDSDNFLRADGKFDDDRFGAWHLDVFTRRVDMRPDSLNWLPMVCTEASEHFVWGAHPSAADAV